MNRNDVDIKKILQMIKENQIDPKEGLEMIKELKQKAAAVEGKAAQQSINSGVSAKGSALDEDEVSNKIINILCSILRLDESEISYEMSFKDMGLDSISGVEIVRDINKEFNINVDAVALYDYATIPALTKYVMEQCVLSNVEVSKTEQTGTRMESGVQKSDLKQTQPLKGKTRHHSDYMYELIDKFSKKPDGADEVKDTKEPVQTYVPKALERKQESVQPLEHKPVGEKIKLNLKKNDEVSAMPAQEVQAKQDMYASKTEPARNSNGIAIIGISGKFPGANNVRQFWRNLERGTCSTEEVPKHRWDVHQCFAPDVKTPNKTYCKVAGLVDNVDRFDPLFFNISPMEAELMDPQQRLFLEEAWKALEDAGYSDKHLSNVRCGVFVGAAPSDYSKKLSEYNLEKTAEAFTGLTTSILAARISYLLNLKGPSMSIDSACSSSLVAIHQACNSIWNNESDMALAGGIRLMLTPELLVQSSQMEILSPTGKCKAFDQEADGTIVSEGVGVVVLKALDKALRDKDYIYGVIRGTGANQDGKTNGITAPSMISQTNLEVEVYKKFDINPENISYVEAHGTGTKLGDPIEVKALTEAFRKFTDKKQFCSLGTVKSNIGHTTMAAGVISLIKVLMAMKHSKIPPQINFKNPNEHINFDDSPFYINTELTEWKTKNNIPKMAVISSFGFSGTNCHIVVEQPPERQ